MYLKNLISAVNSINVMPIEVIELASHLIEAGCQDLIVFHPVDEDPSIFQGVFYQYITRPGVYASPEFVTLIAFSQNMTLDWQRIACCKELIHACDSGPERTKTEEEVEALLEKVLGPLSSQTFGLADIMATKDKLALYQALALLFPPRAGDQAVDYLKRNSVNDETIEHVAKWACLPKPLIEFALTDDWPSVRQFLLEGWGE